MNRLTEDQIRRNRQTQDNWENAAEHRHRVTEQLVRGFVPGEARACVLGAGNCNDLDLPRLAEAFRELDLVDLDGEALRLGAERQQVLAGGRVHLHGGVDVTGVWDQLAAWDSEHPPTDADIDQLLATLQAPPALPIRCDFDIAASVCLLSQLVEGMVHAVGEEHPRFLEVLQAQRLAHLTLLLHLIRPGGLGLLVTDFVSSDTAPALRAVPDTELSRLAAALIEQKNFFHGLNPAVIGRLLQGDSALSEWIEYCQLSQPWRWRLGERIYAVTAFKFRRK